MSGYSQQTRVFDNEGNSVEARATSLASESTNGLGMDPSMTMIPNVRILARALFIIGSPNVNEASLLQLRFFDNQRDFFVRFRNVPIPN